MVPGDGRVQVRDRYADVVGLTIAAGNVGLGHTVRNALKLCEMGGWSTPVYPGCPEPMLHPAPDAAFVHGQDGFGDVGYLPPTAQARTEHAALAIIREAKTRPGELTLVALGPLTNVALAMVKAPEVMARAAQIVLMGGAVDLGNVTPAAEFNIYVDPHAAHVVFGFGLPITMFGLDVTHKVTVTDARLEAIRAIDTPAGRAAYGMLEFYNRYDRQRYDTEGGPLHDPCTIAWLLEPALFEGRDCFVEIDTTSPTCIGRTVVDWWRRSDHPPNATVMREADADGFFRLLNDCLKRL